MTVAADNSLLHDRVLVDQARQGDASAFDELYRRLSPATWRYALAVSRDPSVAAGAVVAAFASTLSSPPGTATNVPVRGQLLAAARHAAFDPNLQTVAVGVSPTAGPAPIRDAFSALPERWRSALWAVVAERLPSHEAGAALGVPASSVTPLTVRAHAGLAEQVIAAYVGAVDDKACRHAAERLIDYDAGRLTAREAGKVRRHLDGCEDCQALLAVIDDLTPLLRQLAVPLPIGLALMSESRWRGSLVRTVGPLGLTLPSGRPMPPWAERALGGAAAAVIALGIASAVLVSGRGTRVRDDGLARSVPAELPISGDGESAAGGSVSLDGDLPLTPTSPTQADGGGVAAAVARAVAPVEAIAAPASVAPVTKPVIPAPAASGTDDAPAEPAVEVTVGIEGVLGVTIGDQCTGVELAGTAIGCQPVTTGAPLEIVTDGSLLNGLGL